MEENTDQFMLDVAQVVEEMFSQTADGIDAELQQLVIRSMYERKTAIPVLKSSGEMGPEFTNAEWKQFESVQDNHSICDAIFEFGGNGQTMEVVEHLLHHVSMVGLHYTFFDDWGVNTTSKQYTHMQSAISEGYYNGNYDEIDEPDESLRVYIQEYAYWVISSAWDIQTTFGGDGGGGEWTLQDPDDFQAAQPEMYDIIQQTVMKVMAAPDTSTLAAFEE
jgi:hypothetical protein